MILTRRFLSLFLALGCCVSAQAATPLVNLVNEHAAVVLSVHDVPGLVAQWDQSPWAKTWNDEQVKRFFAPLREKWQIEKWSTSSREATGYSVNELLAFATGDAVFAISDFDFAKETPAKMPPILIGIDIGDNGSKVEALLAKVVKDDKAATDETSDFSGVTVHTIHSSAKSENESLSWGIVDGKWLASPMKDLLLSAIDAEKSGGVQNPWGKSERFVRLQQRVGDAQLMVVVNCETVYPALKTAVEQKSKENGQQPSGPLGFDPQTMLAALGLDTWRDFYFAARLTDTATEVHGGLTYSEVRGLLKMLAYHDGPPATPAFVSSKWVSASTSKFSVKEAYAALEEILENVSPPLSGLVQGQIRNFNKQLGIDLKRDLIGSVGDTLVAANTISPSATGSAQPKLTDYEQIFAVSLENQEVFTGAIEALKRSLGPQADTMFTARDYLGQKIYTFHNPGPATSKGFSYTIAKGYFFVSVGSASPIESALQGLAGNESSLWDKPEVAAAFSQMPPTACEFQYQDVRAMIGSLFQTLSSVASMMQNGGGAPHHAKAEKSEKSDEDDDKDEDADSPPTPVTPGLAGKSLPIDPSAQPDPATIAKYWSHSWGYMVRETNGIHGVSQIVYPK